MQFEYDLDLIKFALINNNILKKLKLFQRKKKEHN